MSDSAHEPVKVVETYKGSGAKAPRLNIRPDETLKSQPQKVSDADPTGENTESDAEFLARLRKINLNGPLRLDDLTVLDALYEKIGGYVDTKDLEEVLKLNPRDLTELNKILRTKVTEDWAETREMVEFNRREAEITESLRDIDWKAPLDSANVQKLWELQDLYGFELTPDQMNEVIASKPNSLQQFMERMTEMEEESVYRQPYPQPPYPIAP